MSEAECAGDFIFSFLFPRDVSEEEKKGTRSDGAPRLSLTN